MAGWGKTGPRAAPGGGRALRRRRHRHLDELPPFEDRVRSYELGHVNVIGDSGPTRIYALQSYEISPSSSQRVYIIRGGQTKGFDTVTTKFNPYERIQCLIF